MHNVLVFSVKRTTGGGYCAPPGIEMSLSNWLFNNFIFPGHLFPVN